MSAIVSEEISLAGDALTLGRRLHGAGLDLMILEGRAAAGEGWLGAPRVAVEPRLLASLPADAGRRVPETLRSIDRRWRERRLSSSCPETGLALLLGYEALDGASRGGGDDPRPGPAGVPALIALEVDRSVRFLESGSALWSGPAARSGAASLQRFLDRPVPAVLTPARIEGPPRTSLPRDRYLDAVRRVQHHLREGDIYQANLCQQFSARYRGDPFATYTACRGDRPAPRAAFLSVGPFAMLSWSPETFLVASADGKIETWPIKGTRPRSEDPVEDRAWARELIESPKERAELVMIVDLERNDLGRICRTGTIEVDSLFAPRRLAHVHHLVGCVRGRLLPGTDLPTILGATFPGGSITGAPKIRAREILCDLEPVRRGVFTGSLIWLGDDGVLDSSILIRTAQFAAGHVTVGAGGGVVIDSDPEAEWRESNHKASALTGALGFLPEEAR